MVLQRMSAIRQHVNGPRMSYMLQKDSARWNQLCSSLDLIEDTGEAIRAFDHSPSDGRRRRERIGQQYLALYGVLQAMFLQQDAVAHLCESLEIPFNLSDYPRLIATREIRNVSVGHPSKHGSMKNRSHNFISRITVDDPSGITLLRLFATGEREFTNIDVGRLVFEQSEDVEGILTNIAAVLRKRTDDHREKFVNERFADAFPAMLGYAFEKLFESFRNSERRFQASWAVDEVDRLMVDFREKLQRQDMDIDTFESVELVYQELSYSVTELKNYLADKPSDIPNDKMANVAAFYIKAKVDELKQIADDLDSDLPDR